MRIRHLPRSASILGGLALLSACVPKLPEGVDSADTDIDTDSDTDSDADTDSDTDTDVPLDADGDGSPDDDDCDDANASIYPGATELCDNDVDEDCDGSAEACTLAGTSSLADAPAVFHGDLYGMYLGRALAVGDGDSDGDPDVLLGASGTSEAYYFTAPSSGDVTAFDAEASFSGDADSYAGYGVALLDADGDGQLDAALGAPFGGSGGVLLFAGPLTGGRTADEVDASWDGVSGTGWGVSLTTMGDLDGDGADELAVGQNTIGTPYVRVLRTEGADMTPVSTIQSDLSDDGAGAALAAGDFTGDGVTDVLIGAPYHGGSPGYGYGAAFVMSGPLPENGSLADAEMTFAAAETSGTGTSVANAGDVDNDGVDDLLIGAPFAFSDGNYSGCAYVVLGGASGSVPIERAEAALCAEAVGDGAGASVASAGDVNGDGLPDILVGAYAQSSYAGAAYVVLSPVEGSVDLAAAHAKLTGEAANETAGTAVLGAGDNNADGYDDILVAAPSNSAEASAGGAVYLLFGG